MGAAITVVSRARSGIFESIAASGSIESGCLRLAPLGVPVVPEVRITTRPCSAGGSNGEGSPRWIRSSIRGSSAGVNRSVRASSGLPLACCSPLSVMAEDSHQETKRCIPSAPPLTRSANSSS